MKRDEILCKLKKILSIVLEKEIDDVERITLSRDAAWHSIKLIQLVMLIEETFNIEFQPAEIASLDEGRNLASFIEAKM